MHSARLCLTTLLTLAPAGRQLAWASAWANIFDVDIDQWHRCTVFRNLHGQLHVGMFMGMFDVSHPVISGSATLGTDYEELKALPHEEARRHMLALSCVRHVQMTAAARVVRDALALYQQYPTLAYAREGLLRVKGSCTCAHGAKRSPMRLSSWLPAKPRSCGNSMASNPPFGSTGSLASGSS